MKNTIAIGSLVVGLVSAWFSPELNAALVSTANTIRYPGLIYPTRNSLSPLQQWLLDKRPDLVITDYVMRNIGIGDEYGDGSFLLECYVQITNNGGTDGVSAGCPVGVYLTPTPFRSDLDTYAYVPMPGPGQSVWVNLGQGPFGHIYTYVLSLTDFVLEVDKGNLIAEKNESNNAMPVTNYDYYTIIY